MFAKAKASDVSESSADGAEDDLPTKRGRTRKAPFPEDDTERDVSSNGVGKSGFSGRPLKKKKTKSAPVEMSVACALTPLLDSSCGQLGWCACSADMVV